jgi:DNA polymerase-3 subunit beta
MIATTGIHVRRRDGMVEVVATDAKRLAMTRLNDDVLGALNLGDSDETGITIPGEAIALITNMLSGGHAHIEVVENNLIVENADGSVSIRMIDVQYPNYAALLGRKTEHRIALSKAMLDVALQRSSVSLAKDKRTVAVKMSRGNDGIYITSAVAGQSSSECVSEEPGDDISIGFDASYMAAAISVMPKSDIAIDFTDHSVPIIVTSSSMPEVTMLVMPCRVS